MIVSKKTLMFLKILTNKRVVSGTDMNRLLNADTTSVYYCYKYWRTKGFDIKRIKYRDNGREKCIYLF